MVLVPCLYCGWQKHIKALIQLLGNFEIPSMAIDYDSKDKNHEKELDEINEIKDKLFELPRRVDMGDIEVRSALNASTSCYRI